MKKVTPTKAALLFAVCAALLIPPVLLRAQETKRGRIVNSGETVTRSGTVKRQFPPPKSETFKTPPDQPPMKKPKLLSEFIRLDPPIGPTARTENIRPTSPETVVNRAPQKSVFDVMPPGTFTAFRNTSLAGAPIVNGATLRTFIPIEPSTAVNGRVVFYTTNSYAAYSSNGGATFNYLNPFDFFPADGTNDPIDGGFGGDQYVYYERTRGLMLWLIQYRNNGTRNRQRLCIGRTPIDFLQSPCASFVDFTTADFGIPTPGGAGGTWLDFPDVAVSSEFLYLSSNVFCTSGCGNNAIGAVVWRVSLNELLQNGDINFNASYEAGRSGFRLTQGAVGTMYYASHNNTEEIRISRWANNSTTVVHQSVEHDAYNIGAMTANSPDGTNFAAFSDSRILGAWVANGVIGFMWNAAQGGGFPLPHVQVLRFRESDRELLSQGQIWANDTAYLYPSVHPNARGHLGGTMAYSGAGGFPSALAWIADDFNNNTITPLENVTFAVGTAGPNEPGFGVYNRWGDYFSTRMHSPYENTWVGSSFVLQNSGGNVVREPHYFWFGRERDQPPANNTIYVDRNYTGSFQDGTAARPYNTVAKGTFAASPGDTVIIRGGNYNESVLFNIPSTIRNENGIVVIGQP